MSDAPVIKRASPRRISLEWLPDVLRDFHQVYEPVSGGDPSVRIAPLDDVVAIKARHVIGIAREPEWRDFSGLEIGRSAFGDQIIFVQNAPSAAPGSIMAFGMDVFGPGGDGDAAIEGSILLAGGFTRWIKRLREDEWQDYGLVPGGIRALSARRRKELVEELQRLNPQADWSVVLR